MLIRFDLASYLKSPTVITNSNQASCHSRLSELSNVLERRNHLRGSVTSVDFDKLCPTEVHMPFLPVFTALFSAHSHHDDLLYL